MAAAPKVVTVPQGSRACGRSSPTLRPQSGPSCGGGAFSGSPAPPMAQPMVSMMRLLALSTVAGSRSSKRVLRTFSDQAAMIAPPSTLPMRGGPLAHERGDVGDALQLQEGFDGSIRLLAGQHARGVVPELLDDLLIGHPRSAGRSSPRRPSPECPASRSNVDAAERRREVAADGLHVVGVRRDDDPVHKLEYGRIGHRVRVIPLLAPLASVDKERHGVSRVELGAGDAVDLVPGERRRLDARAAVGGHALYLLRREVVLLYDAGKAVEGAVEHAAARVGLVVDPARERPRLPELVRDLVRVPGLVADIGGEAVLRVVEDGGVARVTHLGQEARRPGADARPP